MVGLDFRKALLSSHFLVAVVCFGGCFAEQEPPLLSPLSSFGSHTSPLSPDPVSSSFHEMRTALLLLVAACLVQSDQPWYLPLIEYFEPLLARELERINCTRECYTTLDCPGGLSCFRATSDNPGCCLKALKPNETGCLLDEQCKRACESTVCDAGFGTTRCLCEKGNHFLFNKCWKKCPEFAFEEPVVDERGFSSCQLKTDIVTAMNYMRRMKRQLRSNFC